MHSKSTADLQTGQMTLNKSPSSSAWRLTRLRKRLFSDLHRLAHARLSNFVTSLQCSALTSTLYSVACSRVGSLEASTSQQDTVTTKARCLGKSVAIASKLDQASCQICLITIQRNEEHCSSTCTVAICTHISDVACKKGNNSRRQRTWCQTWQSAPNTSVLLLERGTCRLQ